MPQQRRLGQSVLREVRHPTVGTEGAAFMAPGRHLEGARQRVPEAAREIQRWFNKVRDPRPGDRAQRRNPAGNLLLYAVNT